jgi:hypothetical protein
VAPTNLTAMPAAQDRIRLSWQDNSSNEQGFNIERSPDSASGWAQIGAVEANVTSFTDSGLSEHETYYYRVHARNAFGSSGYSNADGTMVFAHTIYLPMTLKNRP